MLGLALDYLRFRRRAFTPVAFERLEHGAAQRWSADPEIGEGYYHVQWIAYPSAGWCAGETWLVGDQPWADAPEYMVWGFARFNGPERAMRFAWMFQDWPAAWTRQPVAKCST